MTMKSEQPVVSVVLVELVVPVMYIGGARSAGGACG